MFLSGDKKIVIVLDNFEEALRRENLQDLRWLIHFFANMHFHTRNLSLIFCGRLIPRQFESLTEEFPLSDLVTVKASFLDKDSTQALLSRPLNQAGAGVLARFSDAAIDEIYRLTNGHPFLVQKIAQSVVNRFNERLKL